MLLTAVKIAFALSAIASAGALCGEGGAWAGETAPLECFSTPETRQQIASHKLAEPFASIQAAAGGDHGEPIGAKLCRRGEEFVYEIRLLRRDGRVVTSYVDAVSGKPHPTRKER
ncbi:MAG: PepSY domain-containing protein [Methylocystis sp.]|nr:PepSY domain-containing protein [Methylocystis sp.]MBI3275214.1 PepSY domain-containing protein [Methylocystis sp.]